MSKYLYSIKYSIPRRLKVFTRWTFRSIGILTKKIEVQTNFVFVVGCSHSGTTLLTTILGRNSEVLALGNESYLFGQQYSAIKYGVKQWDIIAQQLSKKIFVEKTPKHVYELNKIFKFLPLCKVIYIVRNAEDNIASLYKRNSNFNFSVNKYISDNRAAGMFEKDARVKKVFYDKLVADPEDTVRNICEFIDLNFEPEMISEGKSVFENWGADKHKPNPTLRSEQVRKPIENRTGKTLKILQQSQIDHIQKKLKKHQLLDYSYENVKKIVAQL